MELVFHKFYQTPTIELISETAAALPGKKRTLVQIKRDLS